VCPVQCNGGGKGRGSRGVALRRPGDRALGRGLPGGWSLRSESSYSDQGNFPGDRWQALGSETDPVASKCGTLITSV